MGDSVQRNMGFTRFVQNGRVCLVNFGSDTGKLVTIVDVVDQNRAVVYGPTSGVPRQIMGYKRLNLTDIKIDIGRGCKARLLTPPGRLVMSRASGPLPAGARRRLHARPRPPPTILIVKAMVNHKKHMVRARKAMSTA